ncbi:serine hydrolase [Opitutus sp. ER46]|uniref:serine hydrolase n=1 Tax=Opitutus sp. ER46 TaxID=2161864 RepID=UPI000D31E4A1|nr:serine hydrolase [Opitutus sp. ER46]PTY00150.1 hypothetical protein DB354_02365 [Opitutus sp. ER46]
MRTSHLLGSLFLLLVATLAAAKPPADLQAKVDAFAAGGPGGVAVAWIDRDGVTFATAGQFAADDARPITPDTVFEIGSVTKVFTAILLAESERQGKVSRQDPAAKYLLPPDDAAQAALAKITLLSLTTHTSGLPRLSSNFTTGHTADPYAGYDRAALVEALRRDGPGAPAGAKLAYSNFGVAVLGEALAAAWGQPYAQVLRAQVLEPMGLKTTTLGLAGEPAPTDFAPPHEHGRRGAPWTFEAYAPAGALRSTARDLAAFVAACAGLAETPLRAAIDATLVPQRVNADSGEKIGLGWFVVPAEGRTVFSHGGRTGGTQAFVAFERPAGRGVVLLSTRGQDPAGWVLPLLDVKRPGAAPSALQDAESYVGRYPLTPQFAIDITAAHGALLAQATGQGKLALRESKPDRFSVVDVPAEISFERDAAGKVVALVLHQNGLDQRGARQALPAAPREITLRAEVLREYAGAYPLAPTFVLTVTEEQGALFVQATGQPKFPVFATAKDEFFYKVVDARLSFQRDATGKVSGIVLHQGGRDLPGPRQAR